MLLPMPDFKTSMWVEEKSACRNDPIRMEGRALVVLVEKRDVVN